MWKHLSTAIPGLSHVQTFKQSHSRSGTGPCPMWKHSSTKIPGVGLSPMSCGNIQAQPFQQWGQALSHVKTFKHNHSRSGTEPCSMSKHSNTTIPGLRLTLSHVKTFKHNHFRRGTEPCFMWKHSSTTIPGVGLSPVPCENI